MVETPEKLFMHSANPKEWRLDREYSLDMESRLDREQAFYPVLSARV